MKKIYTLFLMMFLLSSGKVISQFNYPVASATIVAGTYTDLGTNGTAITTKFTGGTLTYDDDTSSVQNIGFNFLYNGTTFTQFVLGTNGFIKLGNTAPADTDDPLYSTNSNLIVPFGEDLVGATGAEYRVATTGAAGSRVCTIQYKNVRDYGEGGDPTQSQYSSANFQIKLYEGSNNIEFVYGTFTASLNPTNINFATVGIIGNSPSVSVNAMKASSSAWTAATFISGPYNANTNYFNNRNTVLPTPGTTIRFVAVAPAANDVSIDNIYPLGSNGKGLQNVVKAYIKNNGSTAKTNLPVTLSVTGANTFTSTITITSLPVGAAGFITFPQYTCTNLGTNTVTVSVPADDVTTNDSKTASQEITTNQINYHIGTTASGSVNASTGNEVAAKFAVPYPNNLSKVDIYFGVAGNTYDINIYNNAGGVPGTVIGSLTGQTSMVGLNSITFPSPIAVSDSFYVSLKQTGAALNLSYQTEAPLRLNAFFLKSGTSAWLDLGNTTNTFRFMMGITTSSVLPVTLTNFSGRLVGSDAALTWSTATEINNKGFEIERSSDGLSYKAVGFVAGAGNSTSLLNYQFVDPKIPSGINYYRLKQIDKDGRSVTSSVIQLNRYAKNGFEVTTINPSKGKVSIQINSDNAEQVSLALYTLNGQLISTRKAAIGTGNNAVTIGENLLGGTYIVKIFSKGETSSYKVIVE